MRRLGRSAAVLAAALAVGTARPAHADGKARCLVRSIAAAPGDGGIEPALADLRPQLTRPPFTAWSQFHLLGSHPLELTAGGAASYPIPDHREVTLTYKEHLQPDHGKHRIRLQLRILRGDEAELSTVFVLDEGGTILTAGHRHGAGITILAVSCAIDT